VQGSLKVTVAGTTQQISTEGTLVQQEILKS
jgi:hypothetical protein